MAVLEINWQPSRRELLTFSLLWYPLFCGVVGWLLWSNVGPTPGYVVWGAAGLGLVGALVPAFARYLYLGLILATFPIGFVLAHVILAVIFYLVFTPIGLIARLVGYDPMRRRNTGAASHWVERQPTRDKSRYFRQF
jgi:ABC-type uncharacterized transport system permease subunit